MDINKITRAEWLVILNNIDEKTGTFRNGKIVCINKDDIAVFSTAAQAHKAGYQIITAEALLKKSEAVLQKDDKEAGIKLGAFVARILYKVDDLEQFESLKKLYKDKENANPEELKKGVSELIKLYKRLGHDHILKFAQELLDAAAEQELAGEKLEESIKTRSMLVQAGLFPDFTQLTKDASGNWKKPTGQFASHLDSGKVKQGTMHFTTKEIDGANVHQFDFKLNQPHRSQLNNRIEALQKNPVALQKGLAELGCTDVSVSTEAYTYLPEENNKYSTKKAMSLGKKIVINFKGLGKVCICSSPIIGSLYNRVTVEIPGNVSPEDALKRSHIMLSSLGLGSSLFSSEPEDEMRKKTLFLFRTFFPKEAVDFEKEAATFSMSPEELQNKIVEKVPKMKALFKTYLYDKPELLHEREILPGKKVYAINTVAQEMRKKGALGLMSGVNSTSTGALCATLARILTNGPLSTQDRYDRGLFVQGASSVEDHGANSADHVFTRLVTQKTVDDKSKMEEFPLSGKAQVLFDLEALSHGAYAHYKDCYGEKNLRRMDGKLFAQRDNLIDFAENVQKKKSTENEVMVKHRIPPQFIRGIIVADDDTKKLLIETLTKEGLVVNGKINGVSLDSFIHVSNTFQSNMWANG